MAADASFTQTIFFIAAIVVAVSISGVLIGMSVSMAKEIDLKSDNLANEMGTDIEIVNDPRHVPYEGGVLTLYLKNTGDISLNYNNIVILIDGQYINSTAIGSTSGNAVWSIGTTVHMNVTVELSSGDHLAKAVMPNGVSATMSFRT